MERGKEGRRERRKEEKRRGEEGLKKQIHTHGKNEKLNNGGMHKNHMGRKHGEVNTKKDRK